MVKEICKLFFYLFFIRSTTNKSLIIFLNLLSTNITKLQKNKNKHKHSLVKKELEALNALGMAGPIKK